MNRAKAKRRRKIVLLASAILAGLLAIPPAMHALVPPVRFHQFMITRLEARHGSLSMADALGWVRSTYSSGWNVLARRPSLKEPDFEDRQAMFRFVFSWLPGRATVYPTEAIYYFVTKNQGREVWGNIRVADLDQGKLTFAYFTTTDKDTRYMTVASKDGLAVTRHSEKLYDVAFGGRTVTFEIPDQGDRRPERLGTLEVEECMGHVHDESGIKFFLMFNRETDSFYYVLDEERGVCDSFEPLEGSFVVGRRTGFVFLDDRTAGRKVLVGVHKDHVARNDYFDGPGDQVPYRAALREKLNVSYPNTLKAAGIDEHGVFQGWDQWARVAICPFFRYSSREEMIQWLSKVQPTEARSRFWTDLTREWWNTTKFRGQVTELLAAEGKTPPPHADFPGRVR